MVLKIIGTFGRFLCCVLVTTSWDGEPGVQMIWYHTHEANISVNQECPIKWRVPYGGQNTCFCSVSAWSNVDSPVLQWGLLT